MTSGDVAARDETEIRALYQRMLDSWGAWTFVAYQNTPLGHR
jgi:hypothetical protein